MKVVKLLNRENIKYNNLDNYVMAFTHTSFVHESKMFNIESYERLEFLGDSILGYIVAEFLYKNFPELPQGSLHLMRSSLVNKKFLSKIGRELQFEKYIQLGQGEKSETLSDSAYEDVFESLVGAIYLDIGLAAARKFVTKHVTSKATQMTPDNLKDHKTKLQEYLQAEKGKSVTYTISNQKRIKNAMHFWAQAKFDAQVLGEGKGLSKKEAEQNAAEDAYTKMVKK